MEDDIAKKGVKWGWILAGILGGFYVLGLFVLILGSGTEPGKGFKVMTLVILILAAGLVVGLGLLLLLGWGTVAWHELGHFWAGRAVGAKLKYLEVGPFRIQPIESGIALQRFREWGSHKGLCFMVSGETPWTRGRLAAFIAGGPIATLIPLLIVLLIDDIASVPAMPDWSSITSFQTCLWWLTVVTGWMALSMLVPTSRRSDAARLWQLTRIESAEKLLAVFRLDSQVQSFQRARDWDVNLVRSCVASAATEAERLKANYIAYYAEWDRGEPDSAMASIRASTAAMSSKSQEFVVWLEFAFALARIEGDSTAARNAISKVDEARGASNPVVMHRARAAIALAEGDWTGTITQAKLALGAIHAKYKNVTPNMQAEIDWNEAMILEAEAAIQTATTPEP